MINKAKQLNQELKKNEEIQEYLLLKEQIKKDKNILSLLDLIKKTQKEMNFLLKENNQQEYLIKRKELEILKENFYENPLIINYLAIKDEVYNLIEQILQIIGE